MRCFVYIAWNNYRYVVNYSFNPLLDFKFFNTIWDCQYLELLSPPLPLGIAYYVLQGIADQREQMGCALSKKTKFISLLNIFKADNKGEERITALVNSKRQLARRKLRKFALDNSEEEYDFYTLSSCRHIKLPFRSDRQQLYGHLAGRILLLEEIEQALMGKTLKSYPEDILQILHLEQKVKLLPSVAVKEDGSSRCMRCGGEKYVRWIYCKECGSDFCFYCEECSSMGEARSCRPLYAFRAVVGTPCQKIKVKLDFPLTIAQRDASRKLTEFLFEDNINEALVWAACGAGKTEVTCAAIAAVLKRGGKVLYAVPRRQIVLEIAKRFKSIFKGSEPAVLYGGSPDKFKQNNLVVATTHQVMRFYRCFDLVILDENDAYPYRGSRMLYYAVKRSCREECKIVYLTATPPRELQKRAQRDGIKIIIIPARHHGYPLPVPKLEILKNLKYNDESIMVPQKVLEILHLSLEGDLAQVLVFVPSVKLTEMVAEELQEALQSPPFNNFKGNWVQYCHAGDPGKDHKIAKFLAGEFPVLVTTTLMERGLTVPRVNVVVLFADNDSIFDTGTLVQMAGRSGRLGGFPKGKVWFIAKGITPAMKEAVSWIKKMNNEAEKRGYLVIPPEVG